MPSLVSSAMLYLVSQGCYSFGISSFFCAEEWSRTSFVIRQRSVLFSKKDIFSLSVLQWSATEYRKQVQASFFAYPYDNAKANVTLTYFMFQIFF